jgi:hypothetical protein
MWQTRQNVINKSCSESTSKLPDKISKSPAKYDFSSFFHLIQGFNLVLCNKKFVTQSRTGLQIYEGHDDELNRPGPMA